MTLIGRAGSSPARGTYINNLKNQERRDRWLNGFVPVDASTEAWIIGNVANPFVRLD